MFAQSIKTNVRAPVDFKYLINLPAPEDDFDKQLEQTVNVYIISEEVGSKFE